MLQQSSDDYIRKFMRKSSLVYVEGRLIKYRGAGWYDPASGELIYWSGCEEYLGEEERYLEYMDLLGDEHPGGPTHQIDIPTRTSGLVLFLLGIICGAVGLFVFLTFLATFIAG